MKNKTEKIKVWIFVIISIAALLYLSIGTGKFHIRAPGYRIYILFNDVSGLTKNAPVMLNGMEIGRIEDMKIVYEKERVKIKLQALIKEDINIPDDPVASIKTLGFMGEKYVHIFAKQKTEKWLAANTVFEGTEPIDMDALFGQAQEIAKSVDLLVKDLKSLANNINSTLESNRGGLDNIIDHLETTSQNFEDFSADLKAHPWKLLFKTKEKKVDAKAR